MGTWGEAAPENTLAPKILKQRWAGFWLPSPIPRYHSSWVQNQRGYQSSPEVQGLLHPPAGVYARATETSQAL